MNCLEYDTHHKVARGDMNVFVLAAKDAKWCTKKLNGK